MARKTNLIKFSNQIYDFELKYLKTDITGQKLFIDFQRHFIYEQDDKIYIYIISIKMAKTVAGKISGVLNRKSFFQL
jgi:hypothetical protein